MYPATVGTPPQAASTLADLDKIGWRVDLDEATLRGILQKHGVPIGSIKKVMTCKDGAIILLADPADEPQVLAVSDPGMPALPGDKPKKEEADAG